MATATSGLSAPHAATAPKRNGVLARFYIAFMEARMRQAMRELARHRHFRLREKIEPLDVVPQDEFRRAGYKATFADAGLLPFVR